MAATMKNPTSSSSSSSTYSWTYHVFMSFRGDTRLGFTGYLYKALFENGINTFIDDREIEPGEEITPALHKAIQESRTAIVIFSKNYASSAFCMEELSKIMECSKERGMLVWPIFYGVDPSDVRYQKGSYAEAFAKHQARFIDKGKLVKWRLALTKAADRSGWHFKQDGGKYEYELIDSIIPFISKQIYSLVDGDMSQRIYKMEDKHIAQHDTVLENIQRKNHNQTLSMNQDNDNSLVIYGSNLCESDERYRGCISLPKLEKQTSGSRPPIDFVCAITGQIFCDPVTLETGKTYEREAIQEWLRRGNTICPITRLPLSASTLCKTNYVLKRLITSWKSTPS